MEEKILRIPMENGLFRFTNIKERTEKIIDEYNAISSKPFDDLEDKLFKFANNSRGIYRPNEFARILGILLFAKAGRVKSRLTFGAASYDAYESSDTEICRELVIRDIKVSGKENVNKSFIPLTKETADDNVADILGMITDELGEIPDNDFEDLLDDFGSLLVQWRALEVPKCSEEDAYELVYELVQRCYEHKAYRTALRLSGLLYCADEPKKQPNLAKTDLLLGMVMYELGYMEAAKQCFIFADKDTKGKCWNDVPEKYRELLDKETKLEMTAEVSEVQKFIDDGIASGKIKVYTQEEVDLYHAGKLEVEFPDPQKQEKERNKIGEKAIKAYEKNKSVEEALAVFTAEPEVYEQAAYLYFMQANAYLDDDDFENALTSIKKAYNCKNGRINGMVLLTFAIVLSKMGRYNEANIYIFRAYILFGKEFIVDKLGEGALEAIEDYL